MKFSDRSPEVRPAGVVSAGAGEDALSCIAPMVRQNSTPAIVRRFRRSDEPGAKTTHWGLAEAQLPPPSFTYGRKTYGSEHVDEVIKSQQFSGFQEFKNSVHERMYASVTREPLGLPLKRNYVFPHTVSQPNFRFGQPFPPSAPVKEIIFPQGGSIENSEKAASQYFRSHGTTQAGEQLKRNYQWPVDPKDFRFGLRDAAKTGTDADVYKPEMRQGTQIVSRLSEEYRQTTDDLLGRSKNLGTGVKLPGDHVFGQTRKAAEWSAGQCITGHPRPVDLQPDKDLGKSVRHGFRNTTKQGDEDRLFGVPSVRYDLPKRTQRSLTDTQNYGDDVPAVQVLFPDNWLRYGLSPDALTQPREKAEVKDLLESAGIVSGKGQFEAIYNKAQRTAGRTNISLREWAAAHKWFADRGLVEPA